MRVAPPVVLNSEQRKTLEQWARSRSLPIRQVQRAQIILLAADGKQDLEIAVAVNISNQKAARWRKRFLQKGFPGLEKDATRPGRPPTITPAKVKDVVRKTTQEKPDNATHWSTRTMAKACGISEKSVRRIWRKNGLKPHLVRTFKVSNDLRFAEKTGGHRRALFQSARTYRRALRRRKEPDPGAGPHPARPSSEKRALRHHDS